MLRLVPAALPCHLPPSPSFQNLCNVLAALDSAEVSRSQPLSPAGRLEYCSHVRKTPIVKEAARRHTAAALWAQRFRDQHFRKPLRSTSAAWARNASQGSSGGPTTNHHLRRRGFVPLHRCGVYITLERFHRADAGFGCPPSGREGREKPQQRPRGGVWGERGGELICNWAVAD